MRTIKETRPRLRFADVAAVLALFIALGGSAYAAIGVESIRSRHIADGQVKSKDLRDGGIKSRDVREGAIGPEHIELACGPDQVLVGGLCYDGAPIGTTVDPTFAARFCAFEGGRLPTGLQMVGARRHIDMAGRPLWTDSVSFAGGRLRAMALDVGGRGLLPAGDPEDEFDFLCVYEPLG